MIVELEAADPGLANTELLALANTLGSGLEELIAVETEATSHAAVAVLTSVDAIRPLVGVARTWLDRYPGRKVVVRVDTDELVLHTLPPGEAGDEIAGRWCRGMIVASAYADIAASPDPRTAKAGRKLLKAWKKRLPS